MHSLLAFLLALGILVAVHEYGHYKVAVMCGVRVLRFSLGFGPVLFRRQFGPVFSPVIPQRAGLPSSTHSAQRSEFVLSLIPLGGYVTFWDKAQATELGLTEPLIEEARVSLFESQSLLKRAAIVAAGPLANLLLCVVLTWVMYLWGVEQDAPVLASPTAGSMAERWGLEAGCRVLTMGSMNLMGHEAEKAQSLQDVESFIDKALEHRQDIELWLQCPKDEVKLRVFNPPSEESVPLDHVPTPPPNHRLELPLSSLDLSQGFETLGLQGPYRAPIIQSVSPGSAGEKAGLKPQDRVLSVDGVPIADAADLRSRIAHSLRDAQVHPMHWRIERQAQPSSPWDSKETRALNSEEPLAGNSHTQGEVQAQAQVQVNQEKTEPQKFQTLELVVQAEQHEERPGVMTARVGIYLGAPPEHVTVRLGPGAALLRALSTTGSWTWQTVHALGQLFDSPKAWSELGGPLTLAKYAGESAGLGVAAFLAYLGLVSVNLGVFNLLPIPVLDGGHLLGYAWQAITGREMGAQVWSIIQRVGLILLLLLTLLALRNDIARWLAG